MARGISFLEKLDEDFHSPVLLSQYLRAIDAFKTVLGWPFTTISFSHTVADICPAVYFCLGLLFAMFITPKRRHLT